MLLKAVVQICNKKDGKFDSVSQKWKMAGNLHRSPLSVTIPECVRIRIFLHILIAHEHGQLYVFSCMGETCPGWKFLRFKYPTHSGRFFVFPPEFHRNNRFRVPIHFSTNRFTYEKINLRLHCYTLALLSSQPAFCFWFFAATHLVLQLWCTVFEFFPPSFVCFSFLFWSSLKVHMAWDECVVGAV